MIYVMSDLHGNYDKYMAMLEKIDLKHSDTLFILGDVVDRGDAGIKILSDMMRRANVIPLLGNHELMAYSVLKKMNVEITEDNFDTQLSAKDMRIWLEWMSNGGETTQKEFTVANYSKRERILEYIEEFSLYETLSVDNRDFVLVHAGLKDFSPDKPLEDYLIDDMLWDRCDYDRVYFKDKYLVTGHTPTFMIDESYRGKIYVKNNHIAIDCGVVYGEKLGCICLDSMEQYYV